MVKIIFEKLESNSVMKVTIRLHCVIFQNLTNGERVFLCEFAKENSEVESFIPPPNF